MKQFNQLREEIQTMSRAAKGHEKYGKEGMKALAKAGRDGKDLDKVRDKYNKYDESVDEGIMGDMASGVVNTAKTVVGKVGKALTGGSDEDQLKNLRKKMGLPPTGKKPTTEEAEILDEAKPGLYANIHAKRNRIAAGSGERMRKPGSAGAPAADAFKDAAKTAKK